MNRAPRLLRLAAGNLELTVAGLLAIVILALALIGPMSERDLQETDLASRFLAPGTSGFLLGTDDLGRDLWARAIAGLRWSVACALAANLINLVIGTTLGLMAAESHGPVRAILRRVTDVFQSFPMLVIAIIVVVMVGHGFIPLVLTLGLMTWPVFMRVAFAEGASLFERDYVKAAHVAGVPRWRIMVGHVLPGLTPSLASVFALHFGSLLIAESGLSFLGIGAPLGAPTWGNMLAGARDYMLTAPWMLFVPAAAIITTVVTANLLASGLVNWRLARVRGGHV